MISQRSAFTLVEMLIVITLIGALAVVISPQINTYLARGRDTERISWIKQIAVAVSAFQVSKQFLPTWTGSAGLCIDYNSLKSYYLQKFPIDPIKSKLHGGCDLPGVYWYGSWRLLALNTAVFSAYFENQNGGNTGTIDLYQWVLTGSLMSEIGFFKKGSWSWYVVRN